MAARFQALGWVAAAVAGTVAVVSAGAAPNAGRQQASPATVRQVQVLEHDRTGVDAPTGLAFSPSSRSFYAIPARSGGGPAETDVVRLAPFELSRESDRVGFARIAAALKNPANVAFDARRGRLLLLDNADRLLEVRPDANGDLDPRTLVRRDALRLDLGDARGMTVDPASGAVYVLDAAVPRIVRIEPAADGSFDTAVVTDVDLSSSGLSGARGIGFDPSTSHLHVGSASELVEITSSGATVATRDLSRLGLGEPAGIAFAPSGDATDDAAAASLYVADAGGAQSAGQIVELSLASAASTPPIDFQAQVVTTINLGGINPPSTDPSGITYVPSTDRLLVSDGEVEETVNGITHFQGANVWELNRAGLSLNRTANISNVPPGVVVPVTNEPAGAGFNQSNGNYLFSADDGKKVFSVNPGADGLVGTAGDTVTSFDTLAAGNSDPEGVTFDTFGGHVFVADGLNREIYQYTASGALVNHFDTAQWGVEDPEAVEFNSVSGTLFILSDKLNTEPPAPIILETTTGGTLIRAIDASATNAVKPAGLAYAPASDGTGAKRFYIVDRGIDNNNDPNAVDGKLYELTTPSAGAPTNTPPSVDAGTDQSIALPASATLNGTVSDDGNPAPPSLTTTWTQLSGPSTVTFGNPNAEDTTASVTVAGVYVVRLTANDGQFSAFDDVTLSFSGSGSSNVFEVRVNAAPDDAEEIADGTVQRGDGDLDMMTDATGTGSPKVKVGMRFNGVAIPQGAPITSAYVQFTTDEVDNASTTLTIKGQAADNPVTFSTTPFDVTNRPTTAASASWSPGSWLAVGDAGLAQRTDNLAAVVQEIVNRSGWASGNSLVLFVTGNGERVAVANNQNPALAPLLHVEWGAGGGNAAPVITSNGGGSSAAVSPAENQAVVTDVDAVDPDPDTLAYSISGGPDAARFSINSSNGVLTFVTAPDFEAPTDAGGNNVYDVTVSVSDGNGGSDSQAIAAAVQNVNEFAPVIDGGASASVSVPENQTAATDINASDGDGDVLTYSLTGGADVGDLTIDPSTGVLTFTVPPDYELPADANTDNFYEVTVTAADASFSDTQAVTIQVTDVAEGGNTPPTITSNGGGSTAAVSAAENQTAVTDVDATDPDVGDTLTYSISGGADATRFAIVGTTGVLTFVTAPNFESPTDVGANNVYDVTVLVSDGNGGSDSQAIAVAVTNENEFTPDITSNGGGPTAAVSAPENQTAVTDVDATDGDGQTITYSIAGGPDAARFTIVASTGVLTFVTAPNFEAPTDVGLNNVYDVTVQASDGSLSDPQAIAVTVTDVAEGGGSPLYFSLEAPATLGGIPVDDEDVVFFDGTSFSLAFDGTDVGLAGFRIDAFAWIDADSLLLSFDNAGAVPGVAGTTDDSDLVRFDATSLGPNTAGAFSLYFDGSDVGLTTSGEDVDAVEVTGNTLLVSTLNTVAANGAGGEDEDLLEFVPTSLGPNTGGTFSLYFDGSDVLLTASGEDVDAAAVATDGKIHLSTFNNFSVTGISGADEDDFVFTPTSTGTNTAGSYSSTLYFDGSVHGLSANDVLAIDLP